MTASRCWREAGEGSLISSITGSAGQRHRAVAYASSLSLALAGLLLTGSAAHAQRLLTLVPGVGSASSASGQGPSIGPLPTAVQVDLELLRGDPSWLEVPTPDGDVLSAERSVFEDRGGGDLMWSGGQPGAGYDTVVLTVEGGRLVGHFAAAGGGAYRIHANGDGRGGMAPIGGPDPDSPVPLCGVHEDAELFHDAAPRVAAAAYAADPPRRVSNPQSHDRLDILAVYTATAAENWAAIGGPHAAIRHAGDYLKMVFRNNQLDVEPQIVHIAEAPAAFDRAGRGPAWRSYFNPVARLIGNSGELLRLRHEHRADLVHVFVGESAQLLDACGSAQTLDVGQTAEDFVLLGARSSTEDTYGGMSWSTNDPTYCRGDVRTFVHEIGHSLGAHHDPGNVSQPDRLFRLYAMGHADHDAMPSLGTAMSLRGQVEPFFSTPRIRPWGAVLGVADEQDNERLLRETVHMGVRYSDYLEPLEGLPAQPTDLRVRIDGGVARLTWRDNAPDADGYIVDYDGHQERVEGRRTEATIPLRGTNPDWQHRFFVQARKGGKRSVRSDEVGLYVPGERIEAPSDVSLLINLGQVRVRWTDNSDNEEWFDVQLLREGEPVSRNRVAADSGESVLFAGWVEPRGGVEYGVRVFAFSDAGVSESSEVATFQWSSRPTPRISATAIGPTTVRVAILGDPTSFTAYADLAEWDHSRGADASRSASGRYWADLEGLARGGRYRFSVSVPRSGPESIVDLTLGERGAGPVPPSDLSLERTGDGGYRLHWRDNSSDELGFEVQQAGINGRPWFRVAIAPANTESAAIGGRYAAGGELRVFAYNERGFSRSSPRVLGVPGVSNLKALAGDGEVRLTWKVRPTETLTGMQLRWKPTAALPFDDAADPWRDISASVGEQRFDEVAGWINGDHTVTGLTNYMEYTFALRALSKSGPVLQEWWPHEYPWKAATPGRPRGSCHSDGRTICLHNSRFEVKAEWRQADGSSGRGRVVPEGTDDSGLFRFFDPSNWEVLIKVLNGCGHNGRVWVLGASTTDLGYEITVTDTITGESRTYVNEPGQPAPAIVDTDAFSAPCAVDAAAR